jgi:serine/threonine protein kinase
LYNLFVTAEEGAWNRRGYEYPRERFCEFTLPALIEKFKQLTPDVVQELKSIPSLFAYEGTSNDLRIGYITTMSDRESRVFFSFAFDDRIAPIPFGKVEPLLPLLDVGEWELRRTHWAIKNEDLLSILAENGVIDAALANGPLPVASLPAQGDWSLLGAGGFGSVYRVPDQRLGLDFAIKVFDPHPFITSHASARARFLREAGLLFRLHHEHIIRVYDAGELPGGRPYIKMEYFAGADLQKTASRHSFASSEALGVALRLARALGHAHERGIVHRDIKPSNVLVSEWLDDLRLIDFGLGILVEEAIARARLTTSSQQFGNAFAAPELLENPKAMHPEIDVYSLGAVWFWMHVRRSPQGAGLDDAISDIELDPGLRYLLRRCLLPAQKRPSAAEVAGELAALLPLPEQSPAFVTGSVQVHALPAMAYLTEEADIRSTLGLDARWTVNQSWLNWARLQVTAAPGPHGEAARVVRLIATWLSTHDREWIVEDAVMPMCRVVVGLDAKPDSDVDSEVRRALSVAVAKGWLRHEEYDDWRPGMASGSGMRDKYMLTPLGKKLLREAGYQSKPSDASAAVHSDF